MTTRIRRNESSNETYEREKLIKNCSALLIETSNNIRKLLVWAVENGILIEYPLIRYNEYLEVMKFITEDYGDCLFRVDGYGYSDKEGIKGNLRVEFDDYAVVKYYYNEKINEEYPSAGVKAVYIYEYPPKTLVSMLFYMLNPSIEKRLHELIKGKPLTKEDSTYMWDLIEVWSKLPENVDNVKIDVKNNKSCNTNGWLRLERYPGIEAFVGIGAVCREYGVDYEITLKVEGSCLEYVIVCYEKQKALEFLLRHMPTSELRTIMKVTSEINKAVKKTYLTFKVLNELNKI